MAAFRLGDVHVNLVDTPGHPDFIAEVERVLHILDGGVLVVSAVEGVQPQTRILMRALRRLAVPTLLFANKIDRPGASAEGTLRAIGQRLTDRAVRMTETSALGGQNATAAALGPVAAPFARELTDVLSRSDDRVLEEYVGHNGHVPYGRLRQALAEQTRRGLVHPVFFGSARTGAGISDLMAAMAELLPLSAGPSAGPFAGTVFKVERDQRGGKIADVRVFSGSLRTHGRVRTGDGTEGKISSIAVFQPGAIKRQAAAGAGNIAKVGTSPPCGSARCLASPRPPALSITSHRPPSSPWWLRSGRRTSGT